MAIHGDLSTLDLTSLLQNLEGARKSGVLTVRDEGEETRLFFAGGRLALIAYPGRARLVDYLVEAGMLARTTLDEVEKRRRRGRTLGAALVEAGSISAQQLAEVASARLVDDACEVLSTRASTFEFEETDAPPAEFDPEELALGVALAASPLLLESARRSDHWALIREHLPTDSAHFTVAPSSRSPRAAGDEAKARFQAAVLELLDGSRSVREVVARFPTRRFDVYQLLGDLSRAQVIRPIGPSDVNRRVVELAGRDKTRAFALLERSLEQNPHQLELLRTKAALAEKAGETEQAVEALKLVAHLELERSDDAAALATLKRLTKLAGDDPFAWEKRFELALAHERRAEALEAAGKLIEIHRKPGLHRKVVGVLERLLESQTPTWPLVRELARARAEAGERDAAAKGLERYAATQIALGAFEHARQVYEEVLALHPAREKAKARLADLKSGALAQRKARWRRARRRWAALFVVFVVLPWLGYEALARRAFRAATCALVSERMIEAGDTARAIERFEALRSRYAWSTTALFDVEPVIDELEVRVSRSGQ